MEKSFLELLSGYKKFREKYALGDDSIMQQLANTGQHPKAMVIACCDSRVDPALILQTDPGDLFVVRNVANIVPPYERDDAYHGTSAALEFGICFLNVKHLILLGHDYCGGIDLLLSGKNDNNDFISKWMSLVKKIDTQNKTNAQYSKLALNHSYHNCLSFPWIKKRVENKTLIIHRWMFDVEEGQVYACHTQDQEYYPLK